VMCSTEPRPAFTCSDSMKSPVELNAIIDVDTPLKPASHVYSDLTYTRRPPGDH